MKLALLFDHFGPYHLARLRAAAAKADVLGIEFHGRSHDYAWRVGVRDDVPLTTLNGSGKGTVADPRGELTSVLNHFKPEVVAIPGWSNPWALRALHWCRANRVPAVLMTESSRHDSPRTALKEWVKRRLVGMFSAALAGGTLHADYLTALGMPGDRVFLGYDVIENEYFRDHVAAIRQKHQETSRPRHFLASARFIEKKNLFRILEAYAEYRRSMTIQGLEPWGIVLLGDGKLRPAVEVLLNKLQLTTAVSMPGFKQYEELPEHYGGASAFIHASTTEQWGLVVNEAMASGLPVLVSDRCGCAPDLVKDGQNGYVFDPYNVNAIAGAMERLSRLPVEDLRRMGQTSEEIITAWGPARFGEGLLQAASVALSQKRVRSPWLDAALLAFLTRS